MRVHWFASARRELHADARTSVLSRSVVRVMPGGASVAGAAGAFGRVGLILMSSMSNVVGPMFLAW